MDYEILYVPENDFKTFVRSRPYELISIPGEDGERHMRWLVEVDGVKKIVRPEGAKEL